MKRFLFYFKCLLQHLKYIFYKRTKHYKRSRCESLISCWLHACRVTFKEQYKIKVPTYIRKSGNCYIDFMIWNNNKQYAVEYNGRQHYFYVPFFHKSEYDFIKQQRRDDYVRDWCKFHNITFVEIPFTWSDDMIINKLKEIAE